MATKENYVTFVKKIVNKQSNNTLGMIRQQIGWTTGTAKDRQNDKT